MGPCRWHITYQERGDRENFHGRIEFVEIGGYDASPTGIGYVATFDPLAVDWLIAELQRVKAEHEAWVERFLAEHPTQETEP
jgi:hypothetical protein